MVKMVERLQRKASSLVMFKERVQEVIPVSVSFAGVGLIRNVVVLEVN